MSQCSNSLCCTVEYSWENGKVLHSISELTSKTEDLELFLFNWIFHFFLNFFLFSWKKRWRLQGGTWGDIFHPSKINLKSNTLLITPSLFIFLPSNPPVRICLKPPLKGKYVLESLQLFFGRENKALGINRFSIIQYNLHLHYYLYIVVLQTVCNVIKLSEGSTINNR